MDNKTDFRKPKWYRSPKFPLLPILNIKKSDHHNTSSASFHWLFFKYWTLDIFAFELAFVCDTHWGFGITAILPYSRIVICIPCPSKLAFRIDKVLNRHPEVFKEYNQSNPQG